MNEMSGSIFRAPSIRLYDFDAVPIYCPRDQSWAGTKISGRLKVMHICRVGQKRDLDRRSAIAETTEVAERSIDRSVLSTMIGR